MRFQLVSDLHLEFASIELRNNGSDVLILSGDICVANHFIKSEASPYFAKAQSFKNFFWQISQEWDDIIYIAGNHEHYHGRFENTYGHLRNGLKDFSNIHILDNEFIDLHGFRIIGGTLWTEITDPIQEMQVEGGLNDFRLIQITEPHYRRFRVLDATRAHRRTLAFLDANKTNNTIFVGHHGPSWESVTPEYRYNRYSYLNPAYVTDLNQWIYDRPEIKLWTHGHVHSSHDYMIGDTRILANPRGYASNGTPENAGFDPDKVFEV